MRFLFTIAILVLPIWSVACSCDWEGNFLKSAVSKNVVFKGTVIERTYYLSNGESFHNESQAISVMIEKGLDVHDEIRESITIEIDEVIKGVEKRKRVLILNTDGADCRESTRQFKVGTTYVFSANRLPSGSYGQSTENTVDYSLYACSENWLEFDTKANMIKGRIRGDSYDKKPIQLSYHKLLKEIKDSY